MLLDEDGTRSFCFLLFSDSTYSDEIFLMIMIIVIVISRYRFSCIEIFSFFQYSSPSSLPYAIFLITPKNLVTYVLTPRTFINVENLMLKPIVEFFTFS